MVVGVVIAAAGCAPWWGDSVGYGPWVGSLVAPIAIFDGEVIDTGSVDVTLRGADGAVLGVESHPTVTVDDVQLLAEFASDPFERELYGRFITTASASTPIEVVSDGGVSFEHGQRYRIVLRHFYRSISTGDIDYAVGFAWDLAEDRPADGESAGGWRADFEGLRSTLRAVPRSDLPDRAYYLTYGPLSAMTELHCPDDDGWRNPDLFWPNDRSWFAANDTPPRSHPCVREPEVARAAPLTTRFGTQQSAEQPSPSWMSPIAGGTYRPGGGAFVLPGYARPNRAEARSSGGHRSPPRPASSCCRELSPVRLQVGRCGLISNNRFHRTRIWAKMATTDGLIG